MIDAVIRLSIRHRRIVIVLALLSSVAGTWAAIKTPIDAVPDLSENQVIVYTPWPGHGPAAIHEQITDPLSRQLQTLDGIKVVRGSSDAGFSLLHLIFEDNVAFPVARQRVQEYLATQTLNIPAQVKPQLSAEGIPTGQIYWYTVEGRGFDPVELRSIQDEVIVPRLSSVPGVAEVASVGGMKPEVVIEADPLLLATHGMDFHDLLLEAERRQPSGADVPDAGRTSSPSPSQTAGRTSSPSSSADQMSASNPIPPNLAWSQHLITFPDGSSAPLGDIARISIQPSARSGMFEKDGNEVVAGIVHIRYGHNPLDVTTAVRSRLRELATSLPDGVRIVPCYDRTPLIIGAVSTVSRALIEALAVAAVCVLLVLRHFRAWLVIALTLPLCVSGTFLLMAGLRSAGVLDVQTNIMSLAGIVISIGVLVDSSIVMTENVLHRLRQRFGDQPVTGDVTDTVAAACSTVGRPVFGSVLVMLISFTPVFALGGIDGRMYSPLAWTKSFALISAGVLSLTLVPALCAVLVRGRIRDESDSAVVRSVIVVYRPVLSWLLDRPAPLVLLLSLTGLLAAIAIGHEALFRIILFLALIVSIAMHRSARGRWLCAAVVVLTALIGRQSITPLRTELRMPLDEGLVMDMPITVPGVSIAQSADDLKARNMVLCRFPEVQMVSGKAGRAETAFDPAPMDMIETMVEFRPKDLWPRRCLNRRDADEIAQRYFAGLEVNYLVEPISINMRQEIIDAAMVRFDAVQRETCWQLRQFQMRQLQQELTQRLVTLAVEQWQAEEKTPLRRGLKPVLQVAAISSKLPPESLRDVVSAPGEDTIATALRVVEALIRKEAAGPEGISILKSEISNAEGPVTRELLAVHRQRSIEFASSLNQTLHRRAVSTLLAALRDECFSRVAVTDDALAAVQQQIHHVRRGRNVDGSKAATTEPIPDAGPSDTEAHHHGLAQLGPMPFVDPHPVYDGLIKSLMQQFDGRITLTAHDAGSLTGFGGELDKSVQMPGWTNVWTRPIQNRVDMLATGVNTEVGVRVMGRSFDEVVAASEEIAAVLREVPGAADVVADPVRGKNTLTIKPDEARCEAAGVSVSAVLSAFEAATSGLPVPSDDHEQLPVKLRPWMSDPIVDADSLRDIPILRRQRSDPAAPLTVPLGSVADIAMVEGPATIKSENGWLRNYVRLNVRDRSPFDVVADAQRVIAALVTLPEGMFIEWTGQYEHAARTRRALLMLVPIAIVLILAVLYLTYRDWSDAGLMLLSAPGALAGGVLCQWLLGFEFSIAVGVGYIACFGMAAATGIVMLVYLREAVAEAGGMEQLSPSDLKQAVLNGAVHRLRPKLLTEATTIFCLAPMLWSTGVGAEVIRPMAAPVLGGILLADEVVDLLIPVLFYHVRRWRLRRIVGSDPASRSTA